MLTKQCHLIKPLEQEGKGQKSWIQIHLTMFLITLLQQKQVGDTPIIPNVSK